MVPTFRRCYFMIGMALATGGAAITNAQGVPLRHRCRSWSCSRARDAPHALRPTPM